jgi:hydroxymethylpyrimidine pyrophosphatase-like HAD family hydrolase
MPAGINKGNSIRWMCDYLNIPLENTIAVGDAENDITMIQTAGIGAVMKNASDDMKQYGNYITKKDNNEGGVAEVIKKFMLET